MTNPFAALGLDAHASAADVRAARRRLAKEHHPDTGGDATRMQELNEAAAAALRLIDASTLAPKPRPTAPNGPSSADPVADWHGGSRDTPSFTVEALPVETFEALLLATANIGEVIDDDPPYRLEVLLTNPLPCWCRLELVPDAGASTVSITVGAVDGHERPSTDQVRDLWIAQINTLDW